MKNIIITGVTGQDGSYMVDYLLRNHQEYKLYGAVRRLSVKNYENISHINNKNFELINLDITDSKSIEDAVEKYKPEFFINFAANSFVGSSWSMPYNHMMTNSIGVLHCLEAIRKYSIATRFYNAGSSEQFGDVSYSPQDINHPFKPRSPYGVSKCSAHHLVKVYRESFGIFAVQGILFNHESPRRGEEFVTRKITKKVAEIRKCIERNKEFSPLVLGNIYSKRDWTDAEDMVDGVWKMLNQKIPKDYILASNETHTIKEFIDVSFDIMEIKGRWIGEGLNEKFVSNHPSCKDKILVEISQKFYRPAEVDLLLGDKSLAEKELGWNNSTKFYDLIRKMIMSDYNLIK